MNDLYLNLDLTTGVLGGAFQGALRMLAEPMFAAEPSLLASWGVFFYNVMLVALGLGFVIFVHELGHFVAAKAFGVQCDKFYVGFDPPIQIGPIKLPSKLFHFQWGETEYGIGIIPLGGYVKMLGQDDDPRNAIAESQRSQEEGDAVGAPKLNPRSYLAKSVFARMVIISAGVVMNLITGVLMAAAAFWIGVPYDVPVLGTVIPGDPAWKAGMEPGDRIVRVNKNENQEMSFRDMQQSIIFSGLWNPSKPVGVGLDRDGKRMDFEVVGTTEHSDPEMKTNFLKFGFLPTGVTEVSDMNPIEGRLAKDSSYSESDLTPLKPGDIITGIDSEELPVSRLSSVPLSYELDRRLEPKHSEQVTLNVLRLKNPNQSGSTDREAVEVVSKPVGMKTFGAGFVPGNVVAIQSESLGEKEGITQEMKPVRWEGQPIVDSFGFLLALSAKYGQTTTVDFEDGAGAVKTLEWKIPNHFPIPMLEGTLAPNGLEIPGTGIVFSVSNIVGSVAEGLPADKGGLKPGDKLVQIKLDPQTDAEKEEMKEIVRSVKMATKARQIDRVYNTQYWITFIQLMRTGLPIEIHYEREGKVDRCAVTIAKDPTLHWPDRGFLTKQLMRTHHVGSVGDALALGAHEVKKRCGNVLEFLGMLVTGHMPFRYVGGPGAIAMEATNAASQGITPLLMFLTLLSANLAIINFLPIPALDGGHMVFLIVEAIIGRPVDEELEGKIRMVGVLGLLALMAAVIFNDVININRFFGG